ncbi:MAG: hypothetical protein ACXAC7_21325 [Candidatus Hodarchaeales archaeon]|jgi:hypothetical protein
MKRKFLSLFLLGFLTLTLLTFPTTATKLKITNSSSISNIIIVEKRVNETQIFVDEQVLVEIIITNYGSSSVYNVQVEEPLLSNPAVEMKNFPEFLTFSEIEEGSVRKLIYTFKSSTADNFTIQRTKVTYYQNINFEELNSPELTSYSQEIEINVLALELSPKTYNKEYLLLFSVITSFYIIILVIRLLAQKTSKSKPNDQ